MNKSPYNQGDHDTLCGLYAVINVAQYIGKIDVSECEEIFTKTVTLLHHNNKLERALITGIGKKTMVKILKETLPQNINYKSPFSRNNLSINNIWNEFSSFLSESNRAILFCIRGKNLSHWTVIKSITQKQLKLYDSTQFKTFNKTDFTTKKETAEHPYILKPTYVFYVTGDL